jgi:hypothetical protein
MRHRYELTRNPVVGGYIPVAAKRSETLAVGRHVPGKVTFKLNHARFQSVLVARAPVNKLV